MIVTGQARERYQDAHRKHQEKISPASVRDFGYLKTDFPDIRTSNGLTQYCCKAVRYLGGHLERTNTMGRRINVYSKNGSGDKVKQGEKWIPGSATTGSSDAKGHIKSPRHQFPIPVYLEIKIGKDFQSTPQERYEKRVTDTGALYCLIKTPEDFWRFYDYVLTL